GPAEHERDQRITVEREADRLAHPSPAEARVTQVESEIIEARARDPVDREVRERAEPGRHLRLGRVLEELDAAPAELEDAHDLVGDDADADRVEGRWAARVAGVGREHDLLPAL